MTWILNHLLGIPSMVIIFLIGYVLNYVYRQDKWNNERMMRIAKERGEMLRKSLESRYIKRI